MVALVVVLLSDVLMIFVPSDVYFSVASISAFLFILCIFAAIMLRQVRAGPPGIAWFKQRTEQVYVRVEDDDFVIRLPGKREAYRPSKLEWMDNRTLKITGWPTSFQLAFRTPDDAAQIASSIQKKFMEHREEAIPK